MSDPLFALVVIAVLIVVGILVLGLTGFGKGSGKLHSHRHGQPRARGQDAGDVREVQQGRVQTLARRQQGPDKDALNHTNHNTNIDLHRV